MIDNKLQQIKAAKEKAAKAAQEKADKEKEAKDKAKEKANEPVPWDVTEWSSCKPSCGHGTRTRKVSCSTFPCGPQPKSNEYCYTDCNPWQESDWSECSATCGAGIK